MLFEVIYFKLIYHLLNLYLSKDVLNLNLKYLKDLFKKIYIVDLNEMLCVKN